MIVSNHQSQLDILAAVKVLDEIPYERFANLSVEETIPMVRNIIIENLYDLNKYTLID
jgi:hypothetical protein